MQNKNKLLIGENETIKKAIIKIKKNGTRTVVVVNNKNFLLGTLTEGDIQKALLKNVKINSTIKSLYNKSPKKIKVNNINSDTISKIFIKGQYGALPVVDTKNIVQKVITWPQIFNSKKVKLKLKKIDVVIMAGGKGERLKPYTEILPKPLIPINSKPMLEHIIDNFTFFNFNKFHLVLNHQAELIKSYFQSKKNFKINYVQEPKMLGTAGGIYFVKKINSEDFIIANCDTLFKIDYNKFYDNHKKNKNFITLAVSKTQHVFPYGFCKLKANNLISIDEKPKLNFIANTGLYFVKKEIINLIPKNKKFEMTDLIEKCLKNKYKTGVYLIPSDSWTDLGQLSDLQKSYKGV